MIMRKTNLEKHAANVRVIDQTCWWPLAHVHVVLLMWQNICDANKLMVTWKIMCKDMRIVVSPFSLDFLS